MKMKLFSLVVLVTTLFSCQYRNELPEEVTKSLVVIHNISKRPLGRLFFRIPVGDRGEGIHISSIPLLQNKDIFFAEPWEYKDGVYGLSLRLTPTASIRWQAISGDFGGRYLAMLMGGRFKCYIKVGNDHRDVKVAAGLSKEEAEDISKIIIRNFEVIKENS